MPHSKDVHDALSRLAAAEEQFLANDFLAPVLRGGSVQVRIAGVICHIRVQPARFQGWGVFRPTSHSTAKLSREASLADRQQYLMLFPQVRLILCRREDEQWVAVPAHRGDTRFRITGWVPPRLVVDAQPFEVISSRFDGSHFWYEGPDNRHEPGSAAYLRQALKGLLPPDQLSRPGLTAEERTAYMLNYLPLLEAQKEALRDRTEERLRQALAAAGAELKEYLERDDVYTVTYIVDGSEHTSAVGKQDLTVQAAGICLSGEDAHFDLQSLVGVLREFHDW